MENLSTALTNWKQTCDYGIPITISDHNEQGEGEFKILNSIRSHRLHKQAKVVIVSPDADVV